MSDWLSPPSSIPAEISTHFEVRKTVGSDSWGNVFLTSSWVLWVDMTAEQHDLAMTRIGIKWADVLVSGHVSKNGIGFRSPHGVDRGEITSEQATELMAAIREAVTAK